MGFPNSKKWCAVWCSGVRQLLLVCSFDEIILVYFFVNNTSRNSDSNTRNADRQIWMDQSKGPGPVIVLSVSETMALSRIPTTPPHIPMGPTRTHHQFQNVKHFKHCNRSYGWWSALSPWGSEKLEQSDGERHG